MLEILCHNTSRLDRPSVRKELPAGGELCTRKVNLINDKRIELITELHICSTKNAIVLL